MQDPVVMRDHAEILGAMLNGGLEMAGVCDGAYFTRGYPRRVQFQVKGFGLGVRLRNAPGTATLGLAAAEVTRIVDGLISTAAALGANTWIMRSPPVLMLRRSPSPGEPVDWVLFCRFRGLFLKDHHFGAPPGEDRPVVVDVDWPETEGMTMAGIEQTTAEALQAFR